MHGSLEMRLFERLAHLMLSGALALTMGHAEAQEASNNGQGYALAQRVCAECHAIDKVRASSPNSAAPSFDTIANSPGMSQIALTVALQTSHRTMPNIMLDGAALRDITDYILSLKKAGG